MFSNVLNGYSSVQEIQAREITMRFKVTLAALHIQFPVLLPYLNSISIVEKEKKEPVTHKSRISSHRNVCECAHSAWKPNLFAI